MVETWLNTHFLSSELFDSSYIVFRRDRVLTNNMTKGGGILLAIESNIASKEINLPHSNFNIEQICVQVELPSPDLYGKREFLFILSYVPPQSSYEVYKLHLLNVEFIMGSLQDHQTVCVLGDFNLGNIVWEFCETEKMLQPFNITTNIESFFVDTLYSLGLIQSNDIKNDINRILDLIFVCEGYATSVSRCLTPLTNESVHHKALEISIRFYDMDVATDAVEYYYDFKSADYVAINLFLNSLHWEQMFSGLVLFDMLMNLKNRKNKAYKIYKISGLQIDKDEFFKLRREFEFLSNFLYGRYVAETESAILTNPKSFWLFFNSKRKLNGIPQTMTLGTTQASGKDKIAELFSVYFSSVYEIITSSHTSTSYLENVDAITDLGILQLTVSDVLHAIYELDVNTSPGLDLIPPSFIRNCAFPFAYGLTTIFNQSLREGHFLIEWKTASHFPLNMMPDYSTRCKILNILPLEDRRKMQNVLFIKDILDSRIDSQELLSILPIHAPLRSLRYNNLLEELFHKTNYGMNEPLSRCIHLFNNFCHDLDVTTNRFIFKKKLFKILQDNNV
ncbi:uncharacterized protein LOC142231432 [Haematobia irritans]|uniref:uncharacterized protein LOC142231432 n=1 Tax=Haematobia irritans TaxID=7368 RepID=UPI003F500F87